MSELTIKGFAGIKNTVPVERIRAGWARPDVPDVDHGPADLAEAVNVDIDDGNGLSLRFGTELQIAGAATSLWSSDDIALMVQSGSLKRIFADMTTTTLTTGIGADVSYVRVDRRVYLSDGVSVGVIDGGQYRTWGLALPPSLLNLTRVQGNLPAGRYLVNITYLRDDGQESGTGLSTAIDVVDNSGIQVVWDAPTDTSISEVAMYVTTQNGNTLYRAVTSPVGDGTATFTGGVLAVPLSTQWLEQPPAGQLLAEYKGIIYVADGEYIHASTALGYELFDARDFQPIDGTKITVLERNDSGLIVGTEKSLVFLKGNSFADFEYSTTLSAGALAGSSIVRDGFSVFGLSELAGAEVVLVTTEEGVVAVLADGGYRNLTRDRYEFDIGTKSAAVFRDESTIHQYILFQQ